MYLEHLIKSVDKKYKKIPISGISFDSRKVKKRNIFFAIDGNKISGSKFIHEAIFKGASVIISNKKIKQKIPCILVKNVRKSLAEVSSKFFKKNGEPSFKKESTFSPKKEGRFAYAKNKKKVGLLM